MPRLWSSILGISKSKLILSQISAIVTLGKTLIVVAVEVVERVAPPLVNGRAYRMAFCVSNKFPA
jgi:hypothetical protein